MTNIIKRAEYYLSCSRVISAEPYQGDDEEQLKKAALVAAHNRLVTNDLIKDLILCIKKERRKKLHSQDLYLQGFDGGIIAAYNAINCGAVKVEILPVMLQRLEAEYNKTHNDLPL